jgi:GNAT superfamily N-acetyltransferase
VANFRPALPSDEPLLWEALYHAVWSPPGEPRPDRKVIADPMLQQYVAHWGSAPGDVGLIAEAASNVGLGAAWLRLLPPPGGYGFVSAAVPELSMAMLPRARSQGIGRELLAQLLFAARSRFSAVSLSVAPDSPAVRFYQRAGFVHHERRADSLVMLCELE